jgi:hypothetical protein
VAATMRAMARAEDGAPRVRLRGCDHARHGARRRWPQHAR